MCDCWQYLCPQHQVNALYAFATLIDLNYKSMRTKPNSLSGSMASWQQVTNTWFQNRALPLWLRVTGGRSHSPSHSNHTLALLDHISIALTGTAASVCNALPSWLGSLWITVKISGVGCSLSVKPGSAIYQAYDFGKPGKQLPWLYKAITYTNVS